MAAKQPQSVQPREALQAILVIASLIALAVLARVPTG